MGRGLSVQQRAILVWAYENGEPVTDPIRRLVVLGIGLSKTEEYQGDGVWMIEVRDRRVGSPFIKGGHYLPAFGHEPGFGQYGWEVKSDVERASVARSLRRLEGRELIERFGRGDTKTRLILTSEGLDLAKSLAANG